MADFIDYEKYNKNFLKKIIEKKYQKEINFLKLRHQSNPNEEILNKIAELELKLKNELEIADEINKNKEHLLNNRKNQSDEDIAILKLFKENDIFINNSYKYFTEQKNTILTKFEKKFKMSFLTYCENKSVFLTDHYKLPAYFYHFLFDFQREGIKFLLKGNALLADEMGLGKTIQIIGLLICKYFNGELRNDILILSPLSILNQWIEEFYRYFPFFRVILLHKKYKMPDRLKKGFNIFITSYETFRSNNCSIFSKKISYFILDEAHKIKNRKTKIFGLCDKINAENRIILTGTPIQNNLEELWTLFHFIKPDLLGPYKTFQKDFIEKKSQRNLIILKEIIEPFLLRREKKDVEQFLPAKKEKIVFCPMSDEQATTYETELVNIEKRAKKGNLKWNHIYRLRSICNGVDDIFKSGKFAMLRDLLTRFFREKKKVVIFSQSLKILDAFSSYFSSENIDFCRIDGSVSTGERNEQIRHFSICEKTRILIISTRAGSLGLNLIAASRLIIYDPDWNPMVDRQAKERIFRFGQMDNIETYTLLTKGTIEERIFETQIWKLMLSFDLLSKEEDENKNEFIEQMKSIFRKRKEDKTAIIKNIYEDDSPTENFSGKDLVEYIKYREMKYKLN